MRRSLSDTEEVYDGTCPCWKEKSRLPTGPGSTVLFPSLGMAEPLAAMVAGNTSREGPTEAWAAMVVPLERALYILKPRVEALPLGGTVRGSVW